MWVRRSGRLLCWLAATTRTAVGSPAPVVVLAAPLGVRTALEGVLHAADDLARRIEVSSSGDRDLVVRLEGVRLEMLGNVSDQACPLLLCVGMLPDHRSWLVGW